MELSEMREAAERERSSVKFRLTDLKACIESAYCIYIATKKFATPITSSCLLQAK